MRQCRPATPCPRPPCRSAPQAPAAAAGRPVVCAPVPPHLPRRPHRAARLRHAGQPAPRPVGPGAAPPPPPQQPWPGPAAAMRLLPASQARPHAWHGNLIARLPQQPGCLRATALLLLLVQILSSMEALADPACTPDPNWAWHVAAAPTDLAALQAAAARGQAPAADNWRRWQASSVARALADGEMVLPAGRLVGSSACKAGPAPCRPFAS